MTNEIVAKSLEERRSVFVILMLVVSAVTMTASLTLIILVKLGIVLQKPIYSSSRRDQTED